jgi:hypothetical protein
MKKHEMASATWFVLRETLTAVATGESPDIILGEAIVNPEFAQNYDKAFGATATYDAQNFIYVRAKNMGTTQAIGSVSVFLARLDRLPHQSEWVTLKTADGRDVTNISADPGAVGVSGAPLVWQAGDAPPAAAPWCLIAEINDDTHSPLKLPPTVKDQATFDTWLAQQTRMAYLIVQSPHIIPTAIPSFTWSLAVELDNEAAIKLGTSVTCTAGSGGTLAYRFDVNDSSGSPIGIGTTAIQFNSAFSQTRTVAPEYKSTFTLTYTPTSSSDAQSSFNVQVSTETIADPSGGDLSPTIQTPVANYTVVFNQKLLKL